MKKETRNINWVEIVCEISEKKEDFDSENQFFNIHFLDEKESKHAVLHIGFSHNYLDSSPEAKDINFDEVIDEEINHLFEQVWKKIFENEAYFVFYDSHWRNVNVSFLPFSKQD